MCDTTSQTAAGNARNKTRRQKVKGMIMNRLNIAIWSNFSDHNPAIMPRAPDMAAASKAKINTSIGEAMLSAGAKANR